MESIQQFFFSEWKTQGAFGNILKGFAPFLVNEVVKPLEQDSVSELSQHNWQHSHISTGVQRNSVGELLP